MLTWESITQDRLVTLISDALTQFGSLLTLSQSPLTSPELIRRALILDWSPATADERGLALHVILRWAVMQLAPTPIPSLSDEVVRPFDDPTWMNPLWWRYNILYHSYINPLHPDQFVPGCKRVDSLIALTGISSHDAFYDERKRALRQMADSLQWLVQTDEAEQAIQQMMVDMLIAPLPDLTHQLLNEAATFGDSFHQNWLSQITTLPQPHYREQRDYLLEKRLMFSGDDGARFIVPAAIRQHLSVRHLSTDTAHIQKRHEQIGRFYEAENELLLAASHYQQGNQMGEAARVITGAADTLIDTLATTQLCDLLQKFTRHMVSDLYWKQIQTLLSQLLHLMGDTRGAVNATRNALQVTTDPIGKAMLFHHLGKLHEDHLPDFALTYYTQAAQQFPADHPQRCDLLKDRAWLHIYRKAWEAAESDLKQAQSLATTTTKRADVSDVYAELYRQRKQYDLALEHAHQALIYREEIGDLFAVAKSYNTLGNIYISMNQPSKAVVAHHESSTMLQKIGNQELYAKSLANIGTGYYAMQEYDRALMYHQTAMQKFMELQMSRQVGSSYYNLVEISIKLQRFDEARTYWEKGTAYCTQYNLQAIHNMLETLGEELPKKPVSLDSTQIYLKPAHKLALELVKKYRTVTRKQLIEQSREDERFKKGLTADTAKRRLTDLVKMGLLEKHGKGAGTHYRA